MEITPDLVRRLKRLRLGGLVPTLPDRLTHARQQKLGYGEFLELLLQDEIDRRDSQGLTLRLLTAGFDEAATFEAIVWDSPVSFDRARVRALFTLPLARRAGKRRLLRSRRRRQDLPRLCPRPQRLPRRPPGPLRPRGEVAPGPPPVPRR